MFLFMFVSALSIVLAASFAVTVFAASDFRMRAPPVKVLAARRECDVPLFTWIEIARSCRAEFSSVGQVNLNSNSFQGFVGGVLHRAVEGIALRIVGQDQSGAVSIS